MSAYLIRSRPSGRKINSRACCYWRVRGRAVTRAQHNIYTLGPTHTQTLTLAGTCTCTHLGLNKHWGVCAYTCSERKQVLGWKQYLKNGIVAVQTIDCDCGFFVLFCFFASKHKSIIVYSLWCPKNMDPPASVPFIYYMTAFIHFNLQNNSCNVWLWNLFFCHLPLKLMQIWVWGLETEAKP